MKYLLLMALFVFVSCSLEKFPVYEDNENNDDSAETDDVSDADHDAVVPDEEVFYMDGVPCTGQRKCYDNDSVTECPGHGEGFYGNDYQSARNGQCINRVFIVSGSDPEKIVSDQITGLVWQRSFSKSIKNMKSAMEYCNDLEYGGFNDWRLPGVKELFTIAYFGADSAPAVNELYFPESSQEIFWTADCNTLEDTDCWYVDFKYGETGFLNREGFHYVRCVRGEKLGSGGLLNEIELYGDAVVYDGRSKLLWSAGNTSEKTWKGALGYCEDLNYANISDWRLPNINELLSLTDLSRYDPASEFKTIAGNRFWSSTSSHFPRYAMGVDFEYGSVSAMQKINMGSVICVQGDPGDEGDIGDTGNSGNTGDSGDSGDSGDTADSGDTSEDIDEMVDEDSFVDPGEIIVFNDTNFEQCARNNAGVHNGPVYSSYVENIINLDCRQSSIQSIKGIEYFDNLKYLNLDENNISDLTPLAGLSNLQDLYIEMNDITDLSPLASLNQLELLHIAHNQVVNLEPLANLTSLKTLNMLNNGFYDISVLANLTLLELIEISSNNISDISPIAGLQNLHEVYVGWNCISDFSSIQHLIDDGTVEQYDLQRAECSGNTGKAICSGIEKCYNDSSEIKCPNPVEEFYGQDAQYLYRCIPRNYSVIGVIGADVVTDNITGLTWQRTLPEIYSGCTGGDPAGSMCTQSEAAGYCENLIYAGSNEWRLPSIKEILTIPDYGRYEPAIDLSIFPGTKYNGGWDEPYWTSSYIASIYSDYFFTMQFGYGLSAGLTKTDSGYVRCVKGNVISGDTFNESTVGGVKIVTDVSTGLIWQKEYTTSVNWKDAMDYCENSTYAGYIDWRLPNVEELQTLTDHIKYNPASSFPEMPSEYFWSSSPSFVNGNSTALLVNLYQVGVSFGSKGNNHYARCVR